MRKINVLKSKIPNLRVGISGQCIYCGDYLDIQVEHLVPFSFIEPNLSRRHPSAKNIGLTSYSCAECNLNLSSLVFWSFLERYTRARNIILRKHNKYYRRPEWSEKEISKLDYSLQTFVRQEKVIQTATVDRIDWDRSKRMIQSVRLIEDQVKKANNDFVSDFFSSWIHLY